MRTINHFNKIAVLLALLLFLAVFPGEAAADESSEMLKVIKKDFWIKGRIEIQSVNRTGNLALVRFLVTDDKGVTRLSSMLLRNIDSTWKMVDATGAGPTTDFLKMNNILTTHWKKLLGKESVEKYSDIMAYLKKDNPRAFHINVNISGDWALAIWVEDPAGGMTLLKKTGGKWKAVTGGGGAMGKEDLMSKGVPADRVNGLFGIQ